MDSTGFASTTDYSGYYATGRHGIVFKREWDALDVINKLRKITGEHFKESFSLKDKEILDPDWNYYQRLHEQRLLRMFSMTINGEGGYLGYYLAWLTKHHHSKDVLIAYSDLIYVKPEHRGWLAYKFIRWVGDRLKEDGVKYNILAFNPDFGYAPFAKRLGYGLLNTQHIKEL